MVETATFRMFHGPRPAAAPAPAPPSLPQAAPQLAQPLPPPPQPSTPQPSPPQPTPPNDGGRAHRRAAREAIRQSRREPQPLPATAPEPTLQKLDYQLLGLAHPIHCAVTATLGDAPTARLHAGPAGIYRPSGFRPAPWTGFGYDVAADRRTGLAAGTHVLTVHGETKVEQLAPGDLALGLRGAALLTVLWIGRSTAAEPLVQIAPGALGLDRPRRPLWVAADHPVVVDAVPTAARDLVNGRSIRFIGEAGAELFHIDVGGPELLLAEGVPAASGHQ